MSLWLGAFVVSIPYVWVLARGVGILTEALALGFVVGTVAAVGLASVGLLISAASNSNKASLAGSVFLLLVLFAPTQLPSGMPQGWFFDVLLRLNPVSSGLAYISAVLVSGHDWAQDLSYLASPLLIMVLAVGALALAGPRLVRLTAGAAGR
jgi:ABC-2 type transport system permease protein